MSESKTKKHRRQTKNWNRMQRRRVARYERKLAKLPPRPDDAAKAELERVKGG